MVEERNASGAVTRSYTLGTDVLAQHDATNGTLALMYDGHGSTRALLGAAAQVVQRYAYEAYGNLLAGAGLSAEADALTRLLYSGEETDRATGLEYLDARYLDRLTGRFHRLDPYRGDINQPLTLNKYLYAHGNSINGIDPTGLFFEGLPGLLVTMGIELKNRAIDAGKAAYAWGKAIYTWQQAKTFIDVYRVGWVTGGSLIAAGSNRDQQLGRMDPDVAWRIGFVSGFFGGVVTQYVDVTIGTAVQSSLREVLNEYFDNRPMNWRSAARITTIVVGQTLATYGMSRMLPSQYEYHDPNSSLEAILRAVMGIEINTGVPGLVNFFFRYMKW